MSALDAIRFDKIFAILDQVVNDEPFGILG